MVFRVLDASAFYAGVLFGSPDIQHTTPQVLDEVRHIKEKYDMLDTLVQSGRLVVRQPEPNATRRIKDTAEKSGDISSLSASDISVLALCMELQGELITDDFAVSNVASILNIKVVPVMTRGIKHTRRWIWYCPGCGTIHNDASKCPECGNLLRKKPN